LGLQVNALKEVEVYTFFSLFLKMVVVQQLRLLADVLI
jgi:hypothetical protein